MKKLLTIICVAISFTLLILPDNALAQGFLKAEGKKIVDGNSQEVILRGMGLGGWMLQEGYMMKTSDFAGTQHELKNKITALIGQSGMEAFYDAWLANYMTEADVDSMASWGFNSIRLPMHYNLYTLPIEQEPVAGENTWLQTGFDLTDSLLKWCAKNKMYLILDLHAAPGGQGKDAAISDYDPTKPSLWESKANRDKTVALWKKLAEHYADSIWIGGYDLINETNWDMSGNTLLANLYKEITDSIRKVDNNHIIYIEGNWFANDFTGLTPPWDDNMVYSFHKYWTYNDQGSIQWMLNMRESQNVPIWLGESGENSNTWFYECIKLMEDNGIGWAWWPLKKIDDIAGPLSVIKTAEYDVLLNYWKNGGTKPTVQYATDALMQMAENLKLNNCQFHPDVIDAMFRQINSTETIPYSVNNIPGVLYTSNFDMGQHQYAYFDNNVANYHLSTNSYTAWNGGWSYRNDGVDIEICEDNTNSNGYSVGHFEDDEWMVYTVNISESAVYNVNIRTASENSNGSFFLQEDGVAICQAINVANSGGWQTWQTTSASNLVLNEGTHKLKIYALKGGFNISSLEFIKVGETVDIQTDFVGAITASDGYTIDVQINKPLTTSNTFNPDEFTVSINGTEVSITNIELNPQNPRVINITISYLMKAGNKILVSYAGDLISATDGTILQQFTDKEVQNTLPQRHNIPGKIQAEDYFYNSGFGEEPTTDAGGGVNLGWTNVGDYLDYYISVDNGGNYEVSYRVAAESTAGQLEMQLLGDEITTLHVIDLPVTGGWQTWETVTKAVQLPQGQHTIRLLVKKTEFNFNWFEFNVIAGFDDLNKSQGKFKVYPNPAKNEVNINALTENKGPLKYTIINTKGQSIISGKMQLDRPLDVSGLTNGVYYLNIYENTKVHTCKLVVRN
ncbi:MAG: carbohydrate-binding protein [Bacteroidales bacterium]|nr:carbohydrate-binding protein [Bacteroidales bacterium]